MSKSRDALRILLVGSAVLLATPRYVRGDVDYIRDVKPIFQERCYACHGALQQKARLRLDTAALGRRGGKSGAAIIPGSAESSPLLRRVTATVADERMPPEGEPLSEKQIEMLRLWIESGAVAPPEETPEADPREHWAFQPLAASGSSETTGNIVDAALGSRSSEPPTADRSLLLRRVYLDLVGRPPRIEEQDRYLSDDSPDAWGRLVDELLASPEHGERWGRHWMDVWRYSDWYGLGAQVRNSQKHIWRWRDWIVESIACDKAYDRMILEMLAADEVSPGDRDAIRATGFLARNYYLFNRTTWLDATIEHTSKALLGLTVNCAKCHDHKYDPISQLDYYGLRAVFEPHQIRIDAVPGETDLEKDGLPRAFDAHPDAPTFVHVRGDPKSPDRTRRVEPAIPDVLSFVAFEPHPVALPFDSHDPALSEMALANRLAESSDKISAARSAVEAAHRDLVSARQRPAKAEASWTRMLTDTIESGLVFRDDFDRAQPDLRRPGSGEEVYRDGRLLQSRGTEGRDLRYLARPPRDFIARLRFRTTGGGKWRSVGIHFDVDDKSQSRKFAYMSAVQPGSKVHVAYKRNGQAAYPPGGLRARPVEVGRAYELTIAVRDRTINVAIDGEHQVAYEYPFERADGFLELSAFDVVTEFDSFELAKLPQGLELRRPDKGSTNGKNQLTVEQAETALAQAKKVLADAEALPTKMRGVHAATRELLTKNPSAELDAETRKILEALRASMKSPEGPDESAASRRKPYPRTSTGRRAAFARWLTDRRHPLTARVAANHVWMRHFGVPLVEPVTDFGRRTPKPRHADLLDALAIELIDSGWSFKHLHRVIATSQAYRAAPGHAFRREPMRVESQAVRDSLLSVAGELDRRLYGAPTDPAKAPDFRRRSLYFMQSRDQEDLFLKTFDNANILACYRRSKSVLPQQTLALANSRVAIEMSRKIAERIDASDDATFVRDVFRAVLGRAPAPDEITACVEALDAWRSLPQNGGRANAPRRARANLVHAIVQHHEFITIR